MDLVIGFTALWVIAILVMREVRCYRWRHRNNRRKCNTPIKFKDRRRR